VVLLLLDFVPFFFFNLAIALRAVLGCVSVNKKRNTHYGTTGEEKREKTTCRIFRRRDESNSRTHTHKTGDA
jgi:hypothetical protein